MAETQDTYCGREPFLWPFRLVPSNTLNPARMIVVDIRMGYNVCFQSINDL